ncbi:MULTISPECIES: DUF3598 family protein [Aphanothece]|uniref:DUF3598 family protein n=1 Tax=Aphanothece TaxID=1121 RepID=UPI00398E3E26
MSSQWDNFLRNLGEWHGSFADLDIQGSVLRSTPSILSLEASEEGRCVHFRLRRFGQGGTDTPPTSDHRQDYRSLGRQVVFFETGAFAKGSLQIAPRTRSGAEYGFVGPDRRLRLVQLHGEDGRFESLVLIREFRAGGNAPERPPLELDQLVGTWQGQAATVEADWPEPTLSPCASRIERCGGDQVRILTTIGSDQTERQGSLQGRTIRFDGPAPELLNLLPDGGSSRVPLQVSHREAFSVEAGWLSSPTERQRLIRRYNDRGEWVSASHLIETRVA